MKRKWEHIGNKESLTVAEQAVEKYNKEHPEYEHITGESKGKLAYSGDWQVGIYRRKKDGKQIDGK